jgi:hypothetical protein
MAQANGVHMVPERYRKTRFTAGCWFYLSQNSQLTFEEYKRASKDNVCRESVFDDVKKSMEMDRLFKNADAVHPPEAPEPPSRPHPAPPPHPPNPAMKEALAAGLAAAGKQPPKGPVTVERRAAAETWIRDHLDEGIAQFKGQFPELELDRAWFDKIRKKALEPAPQPQETEPMPTATKQKYQRANTGEAGRIRDYLAKLPRAKLEEMTGKQYEKASGHKLKAPAQFYAEKKKLMDPSYASARSKREPTRRGPAPVVRGTMFETLAEIPLADLKCPLKELREIVLTLVKALHPRGAEAKVMILSEPPIMEIRVPYL